MLSFVSCAIAVLQSSNAAESPAPKLEPRSGAWRAWLDSPGGELPFGLELARAGDALSATIVNGDERIAVPDVQLEGSTLVLALPHYDSTLRASVSSDGARLDGEWSKRSSAERWTRMHFAAEAGAAARFRRDPFVHPNTSRLEGRWSVRFSSSADPAVGIFKSLGSDVVEGTFLTSTGDYRYLAGAFDNDRLRLSCFDGAHAFLFVADYALGCKLAGDFWSGDRWHETWLAEQDPLAALPDEYAHVHASDDFGLALLQFPDLDDHEHSLAEPVSGAKARILQVFGSWCPNCHDELDLLADLDRRYRARGLSITGLAFELTGDRARDAEQVRRACKRHGVEYPMLLAGLADKDKAAQALPALDRVIAFPTTIFLHRDGRVRAVHTGFSGPGTGDGYKKLVHEFESLIEELISEPDRDDRVLWSVLSAEDWVDANDGSAAAFNGYDARRMRHRFLLDERGERACVTTCRDVSKREQVTICGSTVAIGDTPHHFDRRAGVLLDPSDVGRRWTPASRADQAAVDGRTLLRTEEQSAALHASDALARREALFYAAGRESEFDPTPWLADADVQVRCTAAWVAGRRSVRSALPVLIECATHPSAALRREAARAIGALKQAAGAEALHALLEDVDPLVRKAARSAIDANDALRRTQRSTALTSTPCSTKVPPSVPGRINSLPVMSRSSSSKNKRLRPVTRAAV